MEQKLTEVEHVDHTLVTYPGLGHTFYPADGWVQPLGPIQGKVLADLYAWLADPTRTVRNLNAQTRADAMIIEGLQKQMTVQTQLLSKQLDEARNVTMSVQTKLTNDLSASKSLINSLQSSLSTYSIFTYIAIIVAAIALIGMTLQLCARR